MESEMRPAPLLRRSRITRTAIAVVLLWVTGVVSAQDVTEPSLKAAYIYNFAVYTEWPAEVLPAGAPLVICIVGDTPVADSVQREVKGRKKAAHDITVARSTLTAPPPRPCHVLYASGGPLTQLSQVIAAERDSPVLTLSDSDGFLDAGGVAQFYFEHGLLRFNVNLPAAKRSRLQLSSRLLQLARPR
jgi:hypothetical protein